MNRDPGFDDENQAKQICSNCLYIGKGKVSILRLSMEFLVNLILGSAAPLFDKVRHCPDCRKHSLVLVDSEAGKKALAAREAEREQETLES